MMAAAVLPMFMMVVVFVVVLVCMFMSMLVMMLMGITAALGKVIILHAVLERDSGQNDRACQHNQQRADQIGCCKAGAGHGIQRGERSDVKQ